MSLWSQRFRRGWRVSLGLALVAGLSCTGGGELAETPPAIDTSPPPVDESKPMLAPDGPLRGVVLTAAGGEGDRREPRLAFTSADEDVEALVRVDDVPEGSTIAVSWYRRNPGHQHLFTHHLPIRSGQRARSQALAPDGLPPGIYETVATLGEHQVRRPWIVRATAHGAAVAATSSGEAGQIMQGAGEAGEPADPWEGVEIDQAAIDAWNNPPTPEPTNTQPEPPQECEFTNIYSDAGILVELWASTYWRGACDTVTLAVDFSGQPHTIATSDPDGRRLPHVRGDTLVCSAPGSSDFPGTIYRVHAADSGGARKTAVETMEDKGFALIAGFDSRPSRGSRVSAGETIEIDAMALLDIPALGVKELSVLVDGATVEKTPNLTGSSEPIRCDPKRLLAVLWQKRYTLPETVGPLVEVCARGVGFDGTEFTDCGTFYTADVWEGTLDITATTVPRSPGPCGDSARLEGRIHLVVAADGTVRGTLDVTGPCVSNPHHEFTGTATEDAFHLPDLVIFNNGEPIPKTSPTEARATKSNFQGIEGVGGTRWDTTWALECITCSLPREFDPSSFSPTVPGEEEP